MIENQRSAVAYDKTLRYAGCLDMELIIREKG
jgi:hypothetical protein